MAKRKQVRLKNPMTREQIKNFLGSFANHTATGKRNRLFFKASFELGTRSIELLNMKFSDLALDNDGDPFYHLKSEYSKSGVEDFIPMNKSLYDELMTLSVVYGARKHGFVFRPISKNIPLSDSYMRRVARETAVLVGIPFKVSTHTTRRTFAYHMLKKTNGDIYTVSKLLRHKDITSTMPYLKMFMDDRKSAISGFNITE